MEEIFFDLGEKSPLYIFAHSSSLPMDAPFYNQLCEKLKENGISTYRFEFPYMAKRRKEFIKNIPPKATTMVPFMHEKLQKFKNRKYFVGGMSMGGRIASMVVPNDENVIGLCCLAYPLYGVQDPKKLNPRVEHFPNINKKTLILQGDWDTLGTPEQLFEFTKQNPLIDIFEIPYGDHSFKPKKSMPRTYEKNQELAIEKVIEFIKQNYND